MADWFYKETIADKLDLAANRFPKREAVVFKGERITYEQLRKGAEDFAGSLLRLGIKKGDKVSLWLPNWPEFLYANYAVLKLGAVLVPINTRFKPREVEYVVGQSDSTTLIFTESFGNSNYIEMIDEICPEWRSSMPGKLVSSKLPQLKNLICVAKRDYSGAHSFEKLMEQGNTVPVGEIREVQRGVDPDAPALIMYTSGTTGFPKGAVHCHNVNRNATDIGSRMGITQNDRVLIYLPLFHTFGYYMGPLVTTVVGACTVLMELFDPGQALRLIEEEKATVLHGFDTHYHDLLRHPDFGKYNLSSLKKGLFPAGLPNVTSIVKETWEKLCPTVSAFGMTETMANNALSFLDNSLEERSYLSGYPMPGMELKVIDPATDEKLPPDTPGELCVRGYSIMQCYYNKPEETAKAIDKEGWFHTGDTALLTSTGYLKFMGRYKDMLKVGGENVDPIEVEAYLQEHPAVSVAKIIGVPDERLNEVPMVFIQLKEGINCSEEEIIQFCKGKIANFKIPRYVRFIKEFPMTSSGKVQKFKLREEALRT